MNRLTTEFIDHVCIYVRDIFHSGGHGNKIIVGWKHELAGDALHRRRRGGGGLG